MSFYLSIQPSGEPPEALNERLICVTFLTADFNILGRDSSQRTKTKCKEKCSDCNALRPSVSNLDGREIRSIAVGPGHVAFLMEVRLSAVLSCSVLSLDDIYFLNFRMDQ